MTIDQTISLAASIGACLSAIAAFLTIRQVSKQRESSYHPELVPVKTIFDCSSSPISKGEFPDTWHEPDRQGNGINYLSSFSIPLRNVGLGAAKNVNVTWDFELDKMVSEVNDLVQKSLKSAYFEYDGKRLELKSEILGGFVSNWEAQKQEKIDFVLPSSQENSPVEIKVPHTYIQLVSALIYFSANIKDRR